MNIQKIEQLSDHNYTILKTASCIQFLFHKHELMDSLKIPAQCKLRVPNAFFPVHWSLHSFATDEVLRVLLENNCNSHIRLHQGPRITCSCVSSIIHQTLITDLFKGIPRSHRNVQLVQNHEPILTKSFLYKGKSHFLRQRIWVTMDRYEP